MDKHGITDNMAGFMLMICLIGSISNAIGISTLKPLPKIHYSWPVPTDTESDDLYQLARITGSLTVSGRWVTEEHVRRCVDACKRVNKTNPTIEASLAILFSPFTRIYLKGVPPTNRGDLYYDDLRQTRKRAKLVKQWIGSDIKLTAILLNCERFRVTPETVDTVKNALDSVQLMLQHIFPDARIEWYGRGITASAATSGWAKTKLFTGQEIKASLSCSLYSVPEIERTRETYRRTVILADELGIDEVTPWIALASGYQRGVRDLSNAKFVFDWDYDIVYSYLLGANLNIDWYSVRPERFAPYMRAKVVIFYPPPFDKRVPQWRKHFVAYVRGATGVKELDDIRVTE